MLCWSSCWPDQDVPAKIYTSEQPHIVRWHSTIMFCLKGPTKVTGKHSKYHLMTEHSVIKLGLLQSEILTSLHFLQNKFATFPLLPMLIMEKAPLLTVSLKLLEPLTRTNRTSRFLTTSKLKRSEVSQSRRSLHQSCTTSRGKTISWTSLTPQAMLTSAMRWREAYAPVRESFSWWMQIKEFRFLQLELVMMYYKGSFSGANCFQLLPCLCKRPFNITSHQ